MKCLKHKALRICFSFLLFQVSLEAQQGMLMGIVDNQLVNINPQTAATNTFAPLSMSIPQPVRCMTYHPPSCLFYAVIDDNTVPKLISISIDGEVNLIGNITLPSNVLRIVEAISYNDEDEMVYLSARINLPIGPGLYFSRTLLTVNLSNAICSFITNVNTPPVEPDIDAMTHWNGVFITLDASSEPSSTTARFYRFPLSIPLGGGDLPQIFQISSFQNTTDLTTFQDEVYFTFNRQLYKSDPQTFNPQLIGTTHTIAEYNGQRIQAIATVSSESVTIDLGPDLELCEGETATLQVPDIAGASIVWSNGITGTTNAIQTSGTYAVEVTAGTCPPVVDSITINFTEPPVVDLGPDLELCEGETVTLQVADIAGASIIWSNGITGTTNTIQTSGIYAVEMVSSGACPAVTDSITINFTAPPVIDLGPDLELCEGETVTLQVPDIAGASIVWSNGTTGTTNSIQSSGVYTVQVATTICPSLAIDSIAINFIECPDTSSNACEYKYYIPNVFSPNSDGINDRFQVYLGSKSCALESAVMQIFDRWGELVYEGDGVTGWDGVFRDKKAMTGVYAYVLNLIFNDGTTSQAFFEKGGVTLIR